LRQPENMFCETCLKNGRHTPSEVVDHIIPHKGDPNLFWDVENWQGLCVVCHNIKSAKEKAA
jgi:5-methylcytosine-specific restriction protein A